MTKGSVFDDGSKIEVVIEPDDPPSSGEWVDHEVFFEGVTHEELARGEELGKKIDIDDDEDNGGYGP